MTRFIQPFTHCMSLHIWMFCLHHVRCIYLSIPPLPTGTLQRVNPSLPACFARARQLFITSSWLAPDSQQLLHRQTQILLPYSDTHRYIWMDWGTEEEERLVKNRFLFWTSVTAAVAHPMRLGDGSQIPWYHAESHCDPKRRLYLC